MAASPPKRFYGRRHGRKLRPGLRSLLETRLPDLRLALPPAGATIDLGGLFEFEPHAYWLEIGFGAGEHLIWQAEAHPEVGFIGAEYFINGIAALLREIERRGLRNIRIYEGDGRDLLVALPPAALGRVFILFSDPWRKARHHKRRLVQRATLDRLADLMQDGAELRLATDHADYLVWMLQAAQDHPGFEWLARGAQDWRTRPADWPPTRYEQKAIAEGRHPVYLRYRRRSREGA